MSLRKLKHNSKVHVCKKTNQIIFFDIINIGPLSRLETKIKIRISVQILKCNALTYQSKEVVGQDMEGTLQHFPREGMQHLEEDRMQHFEEGKRQLPAVGKRTHLLVGDKGLLQL